MRYPNATHIFIIKSRDVSDVLQDVSDAVWSAIKMERAGEEKNMKSIRLCLLCLTMLALGTNALPAQDFAEIHYNQGVVKAMVGQEIVVQHYDMMEEKTVETTFGIAPEVAVEMWT